MDPKRRPWFPGRIRSMSVSLGMLRSRRTVWIRLGKKSLVLELAAYFCQFFMMNVTVKVTMTLSLIYYICSNLFHIHTFSDKHSELFIVSFPIRPDLVSARCRYSRISWRDNHVLLKPHDQFRYLNCKFICCLFSFSKCRNGPIRIVERFPVVF